jgi:hypothetical protein
MQSQYITKLVISILKKNLDSRDDVMKVVNIIHDFELKVLEREKSEYYDVFFSNQLSSFKTIDRTWRKVQEINPQLRGANWKLRQVQAGKIAIEQLSTQQLNLFDYE